MRYIIVGNGAAGTTAATEIRKADSEGEIDIISEENVPGYNRPMLTKGILAKVNNPNFNIKPEGWYEENDINLILGVKVDKADPVKKEIHLSDGQVKEYDKLILATGATSNVPQIPGSDLDGVFSIRTKKDIETIAGLLENISRVIVVGGGLLGLETAWEIKKADKHVTVIQRSGHLMNRQLDPKGSDILKEIAEKAGVEINLDKGCSEILGQDGKVTGVLLGDGSTLAADLVIFSAGIRANVDLAKSMGLVADRFIEVDEKMETSIKDIYACGDCASYDGISYGLWSQAVEMGKVAGANAAGGDLVYESIIPSTFFNGMGTMLFSVGDPGSDPEKSYSSQESYDREKQIYEKFYHVGDKLVGGILIGNIKKANDLLKAFKNKEEFR